VANVARRAVAEQLTLGDGDSFPSLTDKQRDLLNASVAIEQQDAVEAGAIGYTARIWAQLSLPYRNPGERSDWERRNGSLTLTITPAVLRDADGNRTRGYPYGVVPRYLLGWLTSEAVRTRSPEIPVGDSLRHFMSKLGMTSTGGRNGSITRVSEQMRRLFGATMHVEDVRNQGDRWTLAGANFSVADSYRLWFNAGDTPGEIPSGAPLSPCPTNSSRTSSTRPYLLTLGHCQLSVDQQCVLTCTPGYATACLTCANHRLSPGRSWLSSSARITRS